MAGKRNRGKVYHAIGSCARDGVEHLGRVRELGANLVPGLDRMLRELDDLVALRAQVRAEVTAREAVGTRDENPRS